MRVHSHTHSHAPTHTHTPTAMVDQESVDLTSDDDLGHRVSAFVQRTLGIALEEVTAEAEEKEREDAARAKKEAEKETPPITPLHPCTDTYLQGIRELMKQHEGQETPGYGYPKHGPAPPPVISPGGGDAKGNPRILPSICRGCTR
jgi:hypothetical protein